MLCDDECEGIAHVLWDCPSKELLRSMFSQFLCLEKTSFIFALGGKYF